ncbi:MAG: Mov34/MPN/PAD-1 family protein [Candidatus Woesearchaeota archaeon]
MKPKEDNLERNNFTGETGIKEKVLKGLKNFLFGEHRINKVFIKEDVIITILDFAKHNHPKEFIAFLGGNVKNNSLEIDRLLYQRFHSSTDSAYFKMEIPISENFFGTVHNHPNNLNLPSSEDLFMFGKYGFIHLIVCYPYSEEDIAAYDFKGERIDFEIKK